MDAGNLEILNKHLQAENKHDLEGTLATLHPECLFEDTATGQIYKGREGAGQYYQLWWNAFDLVVKSDRRHFTEEGNVIAEPRYTGKHVGDFNGIAATGRTIDLRLAVIISFKDGLLAGERFYYDLRTLLKQLGIDNYAKLNLT